MGILPIWQGKGVDFLLLQQVENDARKEKCSILTFNTPKALQQAQILYKMHNYRRMGKKSEFFGIAVYKYMKKR